LKMKGQIVSSFYLQRITRRYKGLNGSTNE